MDFVTGELTAENDTLDRFMRELHVMNVFLYAIDGKEQRIYAYTCGQIEFGGVSIIDTLGQSGLFLAGESQYIHAGSSESTKPVHIRERASGVLWELLDSNQRPPACKAGALNQLS